MARVHLTLLRGLRHLCRVTRGRGFLRGSWILGSVFPRRNAVLVRVNGAQHLEIPLWDGYWMWFALGSPYEPEIERVLDEVMSPEMAFIDGGANIGYWAVRVTGRAHTTVAVEASPDTLERLRRTWELNDHSFQIHEGALWDSDGGTLALATDPRRHAAAGKAGSDGPAEGVVDVPTISLPTLYERYVGSGPVVVKLDIEGAEVTVLDSSRHLFLQAPMLCLYEDHGRDRECRPTASLLGTGVRTWLLTRRGPKPIATVTELVAEKADRRLGYNLAAAAPKTTFARVLDAMAIY